VGQISLPRGYAGLCSWGWTGDSHVVHGAYLFVPSIDAQASLEPAAVVEKNGANFSQSNLAWGGFPRARDPGCRKFDSG
jgi:hypothetical protein